MLNKKFLQSKLIKRKLERNPNYEEDKEFLSDGFCSKSLETILRKSEIEHLIMIFKIILLTWISLLDLMKLYLNELCLRELFSHFNLCEESIHYNKEIIKSIIKNKSAEDFEIPKPPKFKSSFELMSLSLEDLVAKISYSDLRTYSFLNGVFLSNKRPSKKINFAFGNEQHRINISIYHKNHILMTKSKRKDEYIKLGFKFIKKKLLNLNKDMLVKTETRPIGHRENKLTFYSNILEESANLIRIFDRAEPTKKDFFTMNRHHKLKKAISEIIQFSLQEDLILEKVMGPSENLMERTVCPFEFLKLFFGSQQRKSLSLQDAITCFDFMLSCFKI